MFFTTKSLNGGMKKWRADPVNKPPRTEIRFFEYANGVFTDITKP